MQANNQQVDEYILRVASDMYEMESRFDRDMVEHLLERYLLDTHPGDHEAVMENGQCRRCGWIDPLKDTGIDGLTAREATVKAREIYRQLSAENVEANCLLDGCETREAAIERLKVALAEEHPADHPFTTDGHVWCRHCYWLPYDLAPGVTGHTLRESMVEFLDGLENPPHMVVEVYIMHMDGDEKPERKGPGFGKRQRKH